MLGYYAARLPAVEINNTFYRLPKAKMLEDWAGQTPDGFRFVLKASRRITHMQRLKDVGELVAICSRPRVCSAPSSARSCSSCRRT